MGKSKDLATGASYQDQTESDARYVNVSGDTMTGGLNVTGGDVGIGTSSPSAYNSNIDDLVIYNSASGGITIATGTSSQGAIAFADGTSGPDPVMGRIRYDHSNNSMGFRVNNDERMSIDASGRVTMPYQPAFSAYKNGNYTETTGTNRVPSWTEFTDIGSNLDASTGRFTAPVAGMYWFSLSAMSYNLSGDVQFRFYVNGSYHLGSNDYSSRSGNLAQTTISGAIYLSSNDYVEPYFYSNTTTSNIAFYNGQYSHYHGYLIG